MPAEPEPYILTPSILITGKSTIANEQLESPDDPRFSDHEALTGWDNERIKITLKWWELWKEDYLKDLQKFHAKGKTNKKPKVGQVVLISENNEKRRKWPLGVITELIPGRDGRVRAVKLRMATGNCLTRAVQCIFPLEVFQEDDNGGANAGALAQQHDQGEDNEPALALPDEQEELIEQRQPDNDVHPEQERPREEPQDHAAQLTEAEATEVPAEPVDPLANAVLAAPSPDEGRTDNAVLGREHVVTSVATRTSRSGRPLRAPERYRQMAWTEAVVRVGRPSERNQTVLTE